MADSPQRPPVIPDLIVPPRKVSAPRMNAVPVPVSKAPRAPDSGHELGALPIERNVTAPPSSAGGRKQVVISLADDDDLGMEIERTGPFSSTPPVSSQRPRAEITGVTGPRPAGSGLEIAYRRSDLERAATAPRGPSSGQIALAYAVSSVATVAAVAGLVKLVHRPGGHALTGLLPRAFDASSAPLSGGVAIGLFVLAICLGYAGLKVRPRSYAILGSAAMTVLASLAMVTVTLVATDEHPTPPDGALLIPYLVPAALLLLGLGLDARAVAMFLRGGAAPRLVAPLVGIVAGVLVFFAVEASKLAALLP